MTITIIVLKDVRVPNFSLTDETLSKTEKCKHLMSRTIIGYRSHGEDMVQQSRSMYAQGDTPHAYCTSLYASHMCTENVKYYFVYIILYFVHHCVHISYGVIILLNQLEGCVRRTIICSGNCVIK